ncbi:MAG: prepilin-type N-terminal cleavage/methylation domain-containing protein [Holosporales bacterium]|jgi:prepilin-type N-terminal cleavage/methylation domain-containing protein|nr:prepilin-type N-terminal cleavage/methylation domain-containing protein [Holosporales bacterium]
MKRKVFLPGFSLLEVSISLFIVGIISSIFIAQFSATKKIHAAHKTMSNIEIILKSIGSYCISKEGVIPFPSTSDRALGIQNSSMQNSFGLVPFKTLGLMERFAKDGNGRWLLYRMNPFFCKQTSSTQQKNLGIAEFAADSADDKVAIIIKSQDSNGNDETVIWYSEKNFIANYAGNRTFRRIQPQVGLPGANF